MQRKVFITAIIIAITTLGVSFAQDVESDTLKLSASPADSVDSSRKVTGTYYAHKPIDSTTIVQQPTVALFKSLFLPGWGQLGNRKYIKAGVIIALEVTLLKNVIHYYKKKSSAREAFMAETDVIEKARLFDEFEEAKEMHSRISWYTGTLIFLSMFDAFVDAHLARFPSHDKKLTLNLTPGNGTCLGAELTYNF